VPTAIANGFSKIVFGRANGTGNISINSAIAFRDPILLQSPGGQLNIAAPVSLADDATLDFNVKSLVKSGDSVLTINGSNTTTFIGSTIINGGTLLLAKAPSTRAINDGVITINSGTLQLGNNEQIDNAADLTLNGGTFNSNGFSETLDQLQVASNSSINLGNDSSKLAFGNSSSQSWTGILSIENWSSASGETIRFGNNANGLTAAQLNNIQFVGFSRGANINTNGFITPVGITVVNPTPDQDGVSDDIEDLAPNSGDGNFDGIRDSLQENVVSILNLGGVNVNSIATVIAKAGAKISGLRSLANPITTANLTSLANPIEFKVTGLTNGAATTVEYLIAKADQTRNYNSYLMFGATADNLTPHAYEFLYDGQTGAELFDTNGDGFTDKAVVHFVDGLRGDSDLTVNGEIQDPGAPGISNTSVGLSTDVNNVVQITGAAGTAIAKFSLVANQTKKVNEVGFFKIDATNKVRGIAANATGFAQAALQSGQVIFSSLADNLLSTADISRQLQLNAGDRLGFYLVQNGTVDAALQKNDFSNVVFSLDPANPSGKKVLDVTTESNGSYRLKWEQGSAEVNDDLILNLQLQNAPLNNQNLVASIQGEKESELLDLSSFTGQNVQVNFTIRREAAYNDTVGFYKIEDAQGTVVSITGAKLKPGEAGYQAAVVQNRIAGIDLEVANGQTVSINKVLQGGAIYAPFLIANANASNLNGNFSNVYTPYTLGNSDTTDHVRLLGDNTFGFEDLVGGGDKDFNDVVLKAVFKNS
jgi:autotransporter-associated beta strand protein